MRKKEEKDYTFKRRFELSLLRMHSSFKKNEDGRMTDYQATYMADVLMRMMVDRGMR